ncbi:hypothetical protein [Saccharopolyspora griseoalba]|uniref:Uncharacterized protein n=1 Tax=Saccharopolyspora griseoalba TaxID=1431848 RepID=A0ABW2LKR5_9PSEU
MGTLISTRSTAPSHLTAGVNARYQGTHVSAIAGKIAGDVRPQPRLRAFAANDPRKSVRWPLLDPLI